MSIGVSAAIINIIDSNSYFDLLLAIEDSTDEIASIQSLIRASRSVSAFMIFLAVMSILIEIPTIIGRFTLRGGKTILRIFHVLVGSTCMCTKACCVSSKCPLDLVLEANCSQWLRFYNLGFRVNGRDPSMSSCKVHKFICIQ